MLMLGCFVVIDKRIIWQKRIVRVLVNDTSCCRHEIVISPAIDLAEIDATTALIDEIMMTVMNNSEPTLRRDVLNLLFD
jgi:hypothetical protein